MITYDGIKINIKSNADTTAKRLQKCADALDRMKKSAESMQTVSLGQTAQEVQEVAKQTQDTNNKLDETKTKQKHVNKLRDAFNKLKNTLEKTSGGGKKFLASLGRIAMYRAIRSIVSGITQSIKEGLNFMKEYSKAVNGTDTLNAGLTLNTVTAEVQKIKAEIGASVLPMVKSFIPVLKNISGHLTKLFETISIYGNFINDSGDAYTYINPEYWDTLAEEMTKSEQSAKKLNKQLAKFDELNVLNAPDTSPTTDYSKYYKTMYATTEQIRNAEESCIKMKATIGSILGAIVGFKGFGIFGLIGGLLLGAELGVSIGGGANEQTGLDRAMAVVREKFDELDLWLGQKAVLLGKGLWEGILAVPKILWTSLERFFLDLSYVMAKPLFTIIDQLATIKIPGTNKVLFQSNLTSNLDDWYNRNVNSLNSQSPIGTTSWTDLLPQKNPQTPNTSSYNTPSLRDTYYPSGSPLGSPQEIIITVKDDAEIVKKVNTKNSSYDSRMGITGVNAVAML